MKRLLYIIRRISTGDDTSEVLLGTSSHQQKDKFGSSEVFASSSHSVAADSQATFQGGCRVSAGAEGHAAVCRLQ